MLTNKRKTINKKIESRDIINEYNNYGSRVIIYFKYIKI